MHSFRSILGALLSLGLMFNFAFAAPSRIQKRSFKVERVRNVNFKGHNGPRALLKAYQKYSMPLPPDLLAALRGGADKADAPSKVRLGAASINGTLGVGTVANGTGLVTATPERGDVEYLSPISIGGQTINVDFDSGSSDLWVFNSQLPAAAQTGRTVFDPSASQSFKLIPGASWLIRYGDGSGASGNVGTDTVEIGGATVTSQAVELATTVSNSFIEDTANNGLLGLAFSKLNTVKPVQQKTFLDNVASSLAEPLFTADLRPAAAGFYEFGRIDTTKFRGDLTWVPVNTTLGFWQFSSTRFAVGRPGETVPIKDNGNKNAQAIADTGTTLILALTTTVNEYYRGIDGAKNDPKIGGFVVPCNATLPDLMLDIGGQHMARVSGTDIMFAEVDETGTTCFGGLQPTRSSLQIYGDIFFKSQFVVFHAGNNSLGMADHVIPT